jgi:hypothetical protein
MQVAMGKVPDRRTTWSFPPPQLPAMATTRKVRRAMR